MHLLAWLVPGLVQWRAGHRVAGLVLGLAAALVIGVGGSADLEYLELYNRLKAPRSVARDLWAEKGGARRQGLLALGAVVVLGILHGLAIRSPAEPTKTQEREAVPT